MESNKVIAFVTFIASLSVAAERLVEIVKGFVPWLNTQNTNADEEGKRQAVLHLLAAVAGCITAYFAQGMDAFQNMFGQQIGVGIVITGLLTSGGSGFWNSILGYLSHAKEAMKADAANSKAAPEKLVMTTNTAIAATNTAADAANAATRTLTDAITAAHVAADAAKNAATVANQAVNASTNPTNPLPVNPGVVGGGAAGSGTTS